MTSIFFGLYSSLKQHFRFLGGKPSINHDRPQLQIRKRPLLHGRTRILHQQSIQLLVGRLKYVCYLFREQQELTLPGNDFTFVFVVNFFDFPLFDDNPKKPSILR
jgi:hypothetical protein